MSETVKIFDNDGDAVFLCVSYKVDVGDELVTDDIVVDEYVVDDEDCAPDVMVNDDDGHDDGTGNAMHAR